MVPATWKHGRELYQDFPLLHNFRAFAQSRILQRKNKPERCSILAKQDNDQISAGTRPKYRITHIDAPHLYGTILQEIAIIISLSIVQLHPPNGTPLMLGAAFQRERKLNGQMSTANFQNVWRVPGSILFLQTRGGSQTMSVTHFIAGKPSAKLLNPIIYDKLVTQCGFVALKH